MFLAQNYKKSLTLMFLGIKKPPAIEITRRSNKKIKS